jgi:TRAP-type mannitol/chloroaromatic compound transport system substrate-binding protein
LPPPPAASSRSGLFAAGEIVPGPGVLDAVKDGTVECGHLLLLLHRQGPTFAFDTALPFGLNSRQQTAWMMDGGGLELFREFFKDYNIHNIPCGNTGAQMGGWFRKEIKTVDDLKGLKFRVGGFAGQVLAKLGVVPQQIRAATSTRRSKKAPSTPPNGSAPTTTRSSASTRWPSTTTTRAGGKAARRSPST